MASPQTKGPPEVLAPGQNQFRKRRKGCTVLDSGTFLCEKGPRFQKVFLFYPVSQEGTLCDAVLSPDLWSLGLGALSAGLGSENMKLSNTGGLLASCFLGQQLYHWSLCTCCNSAMAQDRAEHGRPLRSTGAIAVMTSLVQRSVLLWEETREELEKPRVERLENEGSQLGLITYVSVCTYCRKHLWKH